MNFGVIALSALVSLIVSGVLSVLFNWDVFGPWVWPRDGAKRRLGP